MEKNNNKYETRENQLMIENSILEFQFPITQSLEISGILILRLDIPTKTIYNENVFGVSLDGKRIIWQIAKRTYDFEECPFTYIRIFNDELVLVNWCSIYFTVNPSTGEILNEGYSK